MICFGGHNRLNPRFALMAGLGFILPVALGLMAPARAQQPAAAKRQSRKARRTQAARRRTRSRPRRGSANPPRPRPSSSAKSKRSAMIAASSIRSDRHRRPVRGVETKIASTQDRLKPLDDNERRIRKSLDGRRAVIGEVLAALQRIGHHPPPALIVSPKTRCNRCAPPSCWARCCRKCAGGGSAAADLTELLRAQGDRRPSARLQPSSPRSTRSASAWPADRGAPETAGRERESARCRTARAAELARQVDNLKDLIAKLEQGSTAPAAPRREERPTRKPPGAGRPA